MSYLMYHFHVYRQKYFKQDFHINNVLTCNEVCDQTLFKRHNYSMKIFFDVTSTYRLTKRKQIIVMATNTLCYPESARHHKQKHIRGSVSSVKMSVSTKDCNTTKVFKETSSLLLA